MARLEFYTVALLGLILLPFGMVRHLSFLAQKTISAVFNCAVKLAVIAFLQAMLGTVMLHMLDQYGELYWAHRSDMGALVAAQCQILLMALLMAFLTTKIPQLIQGLLSGSPSLSGGDMLAPAMAGVTIVASGGANIAGGAAARIATDKAIAGAAGNSYGAGNMLMSALKGGGSAWAQTSMPGYNVAHQAFSRGMSAVNPAVASARSDANMRQRVDEASDGKAEYDPSAASRGVQGQMGIVNKSANASAKAAEAAKAKQDEAFRQRQEASMQKQDTASDLIAQMAKAKSTSQGTSQNGAGSGRGSY